MKDYFVCCTCGSGRDISQAATVKKGHNASRMECKRCASGVYSAGVRATYDPEIKISKAEAAELGHVVYWTGKACANGHNSHRYLNGGHCVKCTVLNWRRGRNKKISENDDPIKSRKKVEDILEARRIAKEIDYLG